MADKIRMSSLVVRDLSNKTKVEIAAEKLTNERIRRLSVLRLYHQKKIAEIELELDRTLKPDVDGIDY
jgi:hypothetical protein